MLISIEFYLLAVAILLLLSVLASKFSDRFGIPLLVIFLVIGMLAGSEGPGGIYFDDPALAQYVGVVALAIILFSGGLDTTWKDIRPVLREGIALSTLGVLITALVVGFFARWVLEFSWLNSFLLGAIVSSTDAAAVFSILRARGVELKQRVKSILELESGSNDPMAVFLTIGLIQLILNPDGSFGQILWLFVTQMVIGGLIGFLTGRLALYLINRVKLGYEGLYPVLAIGLIFLSFGITNLLGGSGFLAVYLYGLVLGRHEFLHKRSLLRFYDGLAWLMQIALFLTLGLLVFPSQIPVVILPGAALAAALILVARPVSVFLSLLFARMKINEKLFISWVGLRGAVPIVLATYPLLENLPAANLIFYMVFFVVLSSVLIQGTSISFVARLLKVDTPGLMPQRLYPIELVPGHHFKSSLNEIDIPPHSTAVGKAIYELGLPLELLIVLIEREGEYLLPNGSFVLKAEDTLLVLSEEGHYQRAKAQLTQEHDSLKPEKS
jgi:potassium/hydrogen antiporter